MGAKIAAALWALVGVVSIVPAILTVFLFDAPGSTSSPWTVALAVAVGVLPLLFVVGAILWLAMRRRWIFFLLPLADMVAIILIFVAIDRFCHGMLAC